VIPNANPLRFNNPKSVLYALHSERADRAVQAGQTRLDRLTFGVENHDAGGALGCVAPGISEIQVKRDRDALFPLARALNLRIDRSSEVFIVDVVDVPALVLQPCTRGARQILIEFEPHLAR